MKIKLQKSSSERLVIFAIAIVLIVSSVAITANTTGEQKAEMITRLKDGKTHQWMNPVSKGVVWDNGMHYDGILTAQDDPVEGLDSEPADDFMFDVDQPVSDVHWIGGYWSPPGDYDFDWRVTFHDDFGDGTKPGAVIATWVFPNSDVNQTNIYANFFSYSVDLPITLTFLAGTKYWITIQGIGAYPPYSGWGYHYDPILLHEAVFRSVYWGYPDWTDQSFDMCFQLTYEEWPNHKMHFPQLPDLIGWDVNAKYPKTLADDWQCSETGPVIDIHFWGSWKDIDGNPATDDFYTATPHFFLSIHSNVPADADTPWSRPGELLWWWQGEIPGTPFDPPTLEGWLDPNTGEVFSNDHVAYWRYDFVDIPDTFIQYKDSIYWLSISAAYIPSPYRWGWKNSRDHFMDDAAYTDNHPVGPWYPIVEPPRYNEFFIEFGSDGMPIVWHGTNYYGVGFYEYEYWWNMWFYDNPFTYDQPKLGVIDFLVDPTGPSSYLEFAINWSSDLWSLEGVPGRPPLPGVEEMYVERQIIGPLDPFGEYTFPIDIPYNPEWISIDFAAADVAIYGSTSHECVGTSLDLAFVITGEPEPELDFGDVPDPPYPTLLANDGARHTIVPNVFLGVAIDPEADGQPDPNALGDDNYGIGDDEDGVVFTTLLMPNCPALVKVTASVTGFIDAWIDYNADGSFEQIFNSQPVSAGANVLGFWVPPGATPGITFSRFRFSTNGGLGPNGLASDGEVEDYEVTIIEPIENIKMHYPQPPDLEGWDVLATYPLVCADDWECTETGAVTDIYFWGSWLGDSLGNIQGFWLSIHSNIPGPPYSQPGDELWSAYITDFTEFLVGHGAQGWFDPLGEWRHPDHNDCWQYDITDIPDPFIQEAGNIYWLDIRADVEGSFWPDHPLWGWKTSFEHFEDDGVWSIADPPYSWFPLVDPLTGITLDMAFVITGVPNNPPYEPSDPSPPDGAIDQSINVNLAWVGGDPDPGNTVTYDVYFGDTSPPPLLVPDHHDTTYDPGTLVYETQYFWKIVARDPQGAETSGPEWDFTTEADPWPNHKMHYPQLPDPEGWDIVATMGHDIHPGIVAADDFMCTESGRITDIHLWGSWLWDVEFPILGFFLSIHDNIPGPPYSMPGAELWSAYVTDFEVVPEGQGLQGWHDPFAPFWEHPNHQLYFRYDITDIPDPFCQDSGTIYWLNVMADIGPPGYMGFPEPPLWGWKTSLQHYEDDAVWAIWTPPAFAWEPLVDPITGLTLDLSFVITAEEDVLCGDVNRSGAVEAGDVVFLISYLFRGGPAPCPLSQGDVNCNGAVDAGDVVYLISYLFRGGPPPCDPDNDGIPDC